MKDIQKIRHLVGEITSEQPVHADCAVTDELGAFMPIAGQCHYAITPEHAHPGWSFIVSFDSYCALDCGFNSSSYFSHCFSRAFNISPSDFKKSLEVS